MNLKSTKTLSSSVPSQRTKERFRPTNGSHGVALNRALVEKENKSEEINLLSTEVYFTVRIANKSLTRRHLRLILDVLLYEVIHYGITLEKYLLMVHLYENLLGQKSDPLDMQIDHERRLCLLTEICMLYLSGKDFNSLTNQEFIPEEVSKEIIENDLIMGERTYNSRRSHWTPEKWLSIRAVGIDSLIERSGNSQRYSSYCKGYGESHPSAHFKKSKPSAELDGKEPSEPLVLRLQELKQLLILNRLRLKPKELIKEF